MINPRGSSFLRLRVKQTRVLLLRGEERIKTTSLLMENWIMGMKLLQGRRRIRWEVMRPHHLLFIILGGKNLRERMNQHTFICIGISIQVWDTIRVILHQNHWNVINLQPIKRAQVKLKPLIQIHISLIVLNISSTTIFVLKMSKKSQPKTLSFAAI